MQPNNPYELQRVHAEMQSLGQDRDLRARYAALRLYSRTYRRAWPGRLWAVLTRQSKGLLDLKAVETACAVRGRCYAGTRAVPIRQIRGTGARRRDFDASFRPLRPDEKERWLSIAMAQWLGVALPAVELVQIRGVYFVCDGHHRISVARALGQTDVDAEVILWDVVGPLPWERVSTAGSLVPQPT